MSDDPKEQNTSDARPALAILVNSLAPYRFHVHRRVAQEIPELRLWTVFTHERGSDDWAMARWDQIGGISFGKGESSDDQPLLSRAPHEWAKGGRIIRWMKEKNIRAVVSAGYNDAGRLRIIRWCARHGVPCFIWGDSNIKGDRATGIKAIVKRLYVGQAMKWAAGALPFGQMGIAFFEKYGMPRSRMYRFPLEPDYSAIENLEPEQVRAIQRRYQLSSGRRRIVYSGRLIELKRIDLLIDAFVAIADQRPQWDLLLVGEGPLRQELEHRLPPSLRLRVTWTGFVKDASELGALYKSSDVLVLASKQDAWALVLNEAAAAGLAIICSDVVGAASELVRDGVNGYVFPVNDGEALKHYLLEATDPQRIHALKAGSARVLADWRQSADPIAGLRQALRSVRVLP